VYVGVSILDCQELYPMVANGTGLGCSNVRWQIYECGPSDSYHVRAWWIKGLTTVFFW